MKKKSVVGWILRRTRRRLPGLVLMTLSNMAASVLGVLFALGTKNIINAAVAGDRPGLRGAVWVQLAVILGLLAALTLSRYLSARLTARLDRDWKDSLTRQILQSDYEKISRIHTGELLNRIQNDVRAVSEGLLGVFPGLAASLTRIFAVVGVLFAMAPWLTGALVALGILVGLATGAARHFLRNLNKNVSASTGKVTGFLQEAFQKLLLIQGMNLEQEVERRGDRLMEEEWRLRKRRWHVTLTANTCVSALGYFSGFGALVYCAGGLIAGTMTFGTLTAVIQLVGQVVAPFTSLSGVLPRLVAMTAAGERLMELEEICTPRETLPARELPPEGFTALCGQDLTFSYDREEGKILSGGSFSLPRGAFALVTGPSGVGKSTLLKLLLGVFTPEQGSLYLETAGGEHIPLSRQTRGLFAYVPQGNLIFSGTIRENLLLTAPEAGQEALERAIYASCMDEFLDRLPQGLDTELGENALGLSEGQAQRLAIARALLGDAPILLLDEATSALDPETERLVLERLRALEGKTCIAVTHRRAPEALADWHLTLREGKLLCTPVSRKAGKERNKQEES